MGAVALDMTNRRWLAIMRYRLAIYSSFGTRTRTGVLMALGQWLIGFSLSVIVATVLAVLACVLMVAGLQDYFPGLQANSNSAPVLKTIGLAFCCYSGYRCRVSSSCLALLCFRSSAIRPKAAMFGIG